MTQVVLHENGEDMSLRSRPKISGGWLVRGIMRLSGGRLQSERAANAVLLILALVIFGLSALILIVGWR